MRIASVGRALPQNFYDQATLLAALEEEWRHQHYNMERLERLHENVLVGGRYLALPLEEYPRLESWGQANDAWIEVTLELGERALREALAGAGIDAAEVAALLFVSVTGIATPSIDARLMNRLPLPAGMRRLPLFGLGCVAGAAGLARAADYLKAYPDQVAALLAVELCSLTLQRRDLSVANLISSGLFGDGAAAVVLTGAERPGSGPRIVASRSVFYRDSEGVMGWRISEEGFRVVLSADVPKVVEKNLRRDVDAFLAEHGLDRRAIRRWIAHPGGPKVLEAMRSALELDEDALALTWRSLREMGNLSSASVLFVLADTLEQERPEPGEHGLLLAMGPGFCSELVLLQW